MFKPLYVIKNELIIFRSTLLKLKKHKKFPQTWSFLANIYKIFYTLKKTLPHIHSHFSQGTLFIWNDFWLHVYQEILSVHRLKDKIHIDRPSWTYFRGLLPCAVSTRKRYKFPDYTHRI